MARSIATERLLLRPFTAADVDWLAELHGDPAVMRYIDDGKPVPRDIVVAETLPAILSEYRELPEGLGRYAAIEKAGLSLVRTFFAEWPTYLEGAEHGDVEYAVTSQARAGVRLRSRSGVRPHG